MGGWEAIGGGGKVEDALADLTGGVAGRFYTKDGVFPQVSGGHGSLEASDSEQFLWSKWIQS